MTNAGVDPTADKIKAVREAREPHYATEVRSFLRLVNFCARFIPDLATVSEPLRRLTRQDVKFHFDSEQEQAFDKLKHRLTNSETLDYYDVNAVTKVICDTSAVGLAAVIVQQQGNEQHIIMYASRSLTSVERRYSQTEREALALVWACEKFHAYLYGIEFDYTQTTSRSK